MKTLEQFANIIDQLLAGERCVRVEVEGYMPLVVEEIGASAEGRRRVAVSHSAVQNGDLMRDPEIVFEFHQHPSTAPRGIRLLARAAWRELPRDYRGTIDGKPALLERDPRGATVLSPVCIAAVQAEPVSFRNDFVGVHQEAYAYDDTCSRTGAYPVRQKEFRSFARMWFRNLRAQGFFDTDARRKVLA